MTETAVDIVTRALADPTNRDLIHELVDENATYIALNAVDEDLRKVLPFVGTNHGPDAFLATFSTVFRYWEHEDFSFDEVFGDAVRAAVFGRFTYRSANLGKRVSSLFAVLARVRDGKIVHFQFLEDSFATARSFRTGGTWTVETPDAGPIEV